MLHAYWRDIYYRQAINKIPRMRVWLASGGRKYFCFETYPNNSFTLAEIARPSANPASFLEATPITFPMSLPLVAPTSAIISYDCTRAIY